MEEKVLGFDLRPEKKSWKRRNRCTGCGDCTGKAGKGTRHWQLVGVWIIERMLFGQKHSRAGHVAHSYSQGSGE